MKSPFKFLDSYTKDDREIFFGREREIEELYHRVFESKIMLVYGVSGTGKSSLINCGLANKLNQTDWLPLNIRRGGNILDSLAASIKVASITPQTGDIVTPSQFKKAVRSLYLDHYKPVFFIFDQFEELFIFGNKEEKKAVVQVIKSLVESDIQCRFIFVMREEYMAGITEFERSIPTIFSNRVRIEKMAHINAIEAIIGPCKVANIDLEEGFADALLEKLSPESADVELTYLQVFLDKIFRLATSTSPSLPSDTEALANESVGESKGGSTLGGQGRQGGIAFTLELFQKTGNVSDLLGSFLDEQISLLSDPDTALAVLKSFVSVRGTKRPMTSVEAMEYAQTLGKPVEESVLPEMLQTFIHLRILREKDQDNRYELRHDALATKIYEKITLVEKELLEIRQLIENAHNNWQKRGVLIGSEDLLYIAPYESRLYLPEDYKKLIEISKNELVKVQHRRRNIISATAILLIIILGGFTFWAIKERTIAIQKERIAYEAKIKATASEQEAIKARDNAIESDKKAIASEKEAIAARDKAKESELMIKKEKEIAVIRERQTLANNFNYLSKEKVTEDPTIALGLARYALSLDSNNKEIASNLNKIYYDNSFYKIFYKGKSGIPIQISPDWTKVISVNGRTAVITDLDGNNMQLFIGHIISRVASHQISRKGLDDITSISFSPDGNSILTGSLDNSARLWDLKGNILHIFIGHTSYVNSVAFSPDGKTIITGSSDRTARLWDLDGKCQQIFRGHKWDILSVAFSPDGQSVLTGSADSTARIWNLRGDTLHTLKGHTGYVSEVIFAPDGKTILTGSHDNTARLWDLNGIPFQTFTGHSDRVRSVAFSPDGQTVLTGSADKTARLWDLQGNILQIFNGHNGSIISVAFSSEGSKILTFSSDGLSRIWDLTQNSAKILSGHKGPIGKAIFSPDGKTILTLSPNETTKLWDLNGKNFQSFRIIASSVAFSPDGKTFLTGFLAAQLHDFNGIIQQTFTGHTNQIMSVAFSPDGQTVLTGSFDKTARLWNLNGKSIQIFTHPEGVISVAFSPDGQKILTGSYDKVSRLWDLNGKTLQTFSGHTGQINSVAFSPDGKKVLTGSSDNTATLWDINGKNLQIFTGHTASINSVAFSPDGQTVLTGSLDKTARLWDLKGNTLQILSGHKKPVYFVSYSPDGNYILTASADNTARLIKVKTPLMSFLEKNSSEGLSLEQQLQFGVIQIDQLIKEKDPDKLFEGLKFCLSEARSQKDKKTEYINYANILYEKLCGTVTNTSNRKSIITYGLDLYRLLPQKHISNQIEKAKQMLLASSTKGELKEAFDYYSARCSSLDSVKTIMKLPEDFIQISRKLLSVDTAAKHTISIDLSSLSWLLLQNRKFNTSLDAIELAIEADSANQYAYVTLPLALTLNNRFDEASKIYAKYYKDFVFKGIKAYRLFFLEDIADLENIGISHPDLIKVKELLNK